MKYAVLKEKKIDGVRHIFLDVIMDTESEAIEYCRIMNELSGVRINYSYECVTSVRSVLEDNLIRRLENIANCLNLAEICFLKHGSRHVSNALYWFNLAKERSKIASDLLSII